MSQVITEVYVPLIFPGGDADLIVNGFFAWLEEVEASSGSYQVPVLDQYGASSMNFEVFDSEGKGFRPFQSDLRLRVAEAWFKPRLAASRYVLKIIVHTSTFDAESQTVPRELDKWGIVHEVESTVYDIVLAANLAFPGSVSTDEGYIFADGHYEFGCDRMESNLSFATEYALNTGWPTLRPLAFQDVWVWLNRFSLLRGCGETPLSRAFNAYTHLFDDSVRGHSANLFWALLGLEALFKRGNAGAAEQLTQKSQLLLGQRDQFKRHLRAMYDIRSRFVHGELGFPGRYYPYDASEQFEKFQRDVDVPTFLAQITLVASLQELVLRNWSILEFSYQLAGSDGVESSIPDA